MSLLCAGNHRVGLWCAGSHKVSLWCAWNHRVGLCGTRGAHTHVSVRFALRLTLQGAAKPACYAATPPPPACRRPGAVTLSVSGCNPMSWEAAAPCIQGVPMSMPEPLVDGVAEVQRAGDERDAALEV